MADAIDQEDFDQFWAGWTESGDLLDNTRISVFQTTLGRRLSTRIERCGHGQHYVAWSSEPVPGARAASRSLFLVVRCGPGNVDEVLSELRDAVAPNDMCIVFPLGSGSYLADLVGASLLPIAVLAREAVKDILVGHVPAGDLLTSEIAHRAGRGMWRIVNPYAAQSPVGPGMFFGREKERETLMTGTASGFAVVGPRGIGKSSILLQMKRLAPKDTVTIYVECEASGKPEDVQGLVMKALFPQSFSAGTRHRLSEMVPRKTKRLVLLLDEADPLVVYCDKNKRTDFYGDIKEAIAKGAKIIIAGYREFRDAVLSAEHPLYNQLQVLPLGPLESEEASELLLEPTKEIGISFWNDDEAASRIMNWSSGHPMYIQMFCQRLIDLCVSKHRHRVEPAQFDAVERDGRIYESVVNAFIQTTDALEKCVTYAGMGLKAPFGAEDIAEALEKTWHFDPGMNAVLRACDRLVLANVFAREGTGLRFLFAAFPQVVRLHQNVDRQMSLLVREAERAVSVC